MLAHRALMDLYSPSEMTGARIVNRWVKEAFIVSIPDPIEKITSNIAIMEAVQNRTKYSTSRCAPLVLLSIEMWSSSPANVVSDATKVARANTPRKVANPIGSASGEAARL